MFEIAIIGASGSGKSDLAIEIATKKNANILSLDSLSIYKEIDIVSAKPPKEELNLIKHFGIDVIYPNESFSVKNFFDIYIDAKQSSIKESKNLVIVGGSSFYLKAMLDGLSELKISQDIKNQTSKLQTNEAFELLKSIDLAYSQKISSSDRYRILKAIEIYQESGKRPTDFFNTQLREPLIKKIDIFEIETPKELLKDRIYKRTEKMIKNGLLDEIFYLENRYTRLYTPMKSIGIKESLEYLDGKIKTLDELKVSISQNTLKLAKRQKTFNKTQFIKTSDSLENLQKRLLESL